MIKLKLKNISLSPKCETDTLNIYNYHRITDIIRCTKSCKHIYQPKTIWFKKSTFQKLLSFNCVHLKEQSVKTTTIKKNPKFSGLYFLSKVHEKWVIWDNNMWVKLKCLNTFKDVFLQTVLKWSLSVSTSGKTIFENKMPI